MDLAWDYSRCCAHSHLVAQPTDLELDVLRDLAHVHELPVV
eukprot:SAG22_NODE_1064_length_5756_cov_48.259502_4_plen_41_part_00